MYSFAIPLVFAYKILICFLNVLKSNINWDFYSPENVKGL